MFDCEKMLCVVCGKSIELTALEFAILQLLAKSPGRIYSRAQMIDQVYSDYRVVNERTMDSHIKKLRKRLKEASGDLELIHSIYGIGYKLEMP
jgi:two-component system response regulator BaeR